MWHINKIKANNVASFKELVFEPTMGVATLIFGDNKDNSENQPSNGSGKSALIESIAISLTGDPLRKVKIDEIIRDDANEMNVMAELWNDETKDVLSISRMFSRKNPQKISVTLNGIEMVQPSVLDYNKYILELIGITKDEFYSYYILTESHYVSFFSSSDKEKKAIINKFSNADLIDEAILSIGNDMEPVQCELEKWQLSIERLNGAIEVLEKQIEQSKQQEREIENSKEARKAELQHLIAEKRGSIRESKEVIEKLQEDLEKVKHVNDIIESIENDDTISFAMKYGVIEKSLADSNLSSTLTNWPKQSEELEEKICNIEKIISEESDELDKLKERISSVQSYVAGAEEKVSISQNSLDEFMDEYETNMGEARYVKEIAEKKANEMQDRLSNLRKSIANLKNRIAGTIECPNCKHRFVVGDNVDVEKTEKEIFESETTYSSLYKQNADTDWFADYNTIVSKLSASKKSLEYNVDAASAELRTYKNGLNSLFNDESVISGAITSHRNTISNIGKQISDLSKKMFSQAYDIIDDSMDAIERKIKRYNTDINSFEGAITTYEKQIDELDNQKESFTIEMLLKNLSQKKTERYASQNEFDRYKEQYDLLNEQEKRFVRFKSVLANSKINALSQMLNGILEEIGSDLRVRIDGFKTLKNGTVRDKITVSILKDGVDFGSASKLSKGERTRIDTACIVAMSKLVNSKCDNEKGLDLLIMDEILSGVDEKGLLGIYDALNKLKVTTIVVSHNPVAQSYPYTLTVTKEHGISTI